MNVSSSSEASEDGESGGSIDEQNSNKKITWKKNKLSTKSKTVQFSM